MLRKCPDSIIIPEVVVWLERKGISLQVRLIFFFLPNLTAWYLLITL